MRLLRANCPINRTVSRRPQLYQHERLRRGGFLPVGFQRRGDLSGRCPAEVIDGFAADFDPDQRWIGLFFVLLQRDQACRARAVVRTTIRVAVTPSASPFSKSPSVCAMLFVTWAKQITDRLVAFAKA